MSFQKKLRVGFAVGIASLVAIACGTSVSGSGFTVGDSDDGGVVTNTTSDASKPTGFGATDGAPREGGTGCIPTTCAAQNANCGPIGDGCGGTIDSCGTCGSDQSCGGGGAPSQCGKPDCTPKSCAEVGANCGPVGDGCGGVIASCGTCTNPGEICGGGGPSFCGKGLPTGDGGADGGSGCTPKTCADVGANCGPVADGCGGLITSCGSCTAPQTCGGGGLPSVCGGNAACVPQTCAGAGANCGPLADGCGNLIQCGTCMNAGDICGGGGKPNVCGSSSSVTCTGLCLQQKVCAGGATTSISGTVLSPAGNLPIPGALVYVPNAPVAPFTPGLTCDQCGAAASGSPLVTTTTGPDGKFLLPNVPVSDPTKVQNIPVVIQLGRWRKQITVQTTACTNTVLPATLTSLPKNKSQGDIPLTAISTGEIDALECVLRKIGIDDAEFTDPSGTGRIRFYQDNGAEISSSTPGASTLYSSLTELEKYDMVLFACVASEVDKKASYRNNVKAYADAGGRVFATHYSYVWLFDESPWSSTADWSNVDETYQDTPIPVEVDQTSAKGTEFAQWLNVVGALSSPLPNPKVMITESRHDVNNPVASAATRFLFSKTSDGAPYNSVQHYTFNTPWGLPPAQQCGRVLYSDFHVTTGSSSENVKFPKECDSNPLTSQEKVLAFMLFDLASCVAAAPPSPPTCTPKSCKDQGLTCGPAGDGCGNTIAGGCGTCPAGETCGGGGVAGACGAPMCTKIKCLSNQCGEIADGCGGVVDCGACAVGNCGGGGPNICGTPTCTKETCAQAPAGTCGPVADGCGGINQCACAGGAPCVNGKCGAPACTPRTCDQAGANCGQVSDGCGGLTADCGTCLAPQTCGGGGLANVCGGGIN